MALRGQSILAKIEAAQSCCLNLATGGSASYEDYENRRDEALEKCSSQNVADACSRCFQGRDEIKKLLGKLST
jgi:cation transport regulator ChaB